MIIQERFTINDKEFIRTYSDADRCVVGGVPYGEYAEAIDPAELGRTYIEGDPLPELTDEETLAILLGGGEA